MGNHNKPPSKPEQDAKSIKSTVEKSSKKPVEKQESESAVYVCMSKDDVIRELASRIKVETREESLKRLNGASEIKLLVKPVVLPFTRDEFEYSLQEDGCWRELQTGTLKTHTEVKLHCGPQCLFFKPRGCCTISTIHGDEERGTAEADGFHLTGKNGMEGKEDERITDLPILNITKGELRSSMAWLEKGLAKSWKHILLCVLAIIFLPRLHEIGDFLIGTLDVIEAKVGAIIMWWVGIREDVYSYQLIEVREVNTKDFISCNANLYSWAELSCSISSCFGIAKAGIPMVSLRALKCGALGCRAGALMPLAQVTNYAKNFEKARSERFEVAFGSKGQIDGTSGRQYPEPCDFFLPRSLQFLWLEIVTVCMVVVLVVGGYLLFLFWRRSPSTKEDLTDPKGMERRKSEEITK